MENKVYSDQFGTQDMSGWLGEKTEYIIEALLRLHKEIDEINKEPENPYAYEEPKGIYYIDEAPYATILSIHNSIISL